MYRVVLINHGNVVYEGPDQVMAIMKAQFSGFQAVVYSPDGAVMSYSPISGWRSE